MIDCSYLPFQSAREYQDPGMQKWMGFFLSQLYIGQLKGRFTVKYRVQKLTIDGMIRELSNKEISVKTSDGYRRVQIEDILQIQPVEDVIYE